FDLQSPQSYVSLLNTQYTLATLGQDTVLLKNVFEVEVSPTANDPSFARFDLNMSNTFFNDDFSQVLTIGDQPGFSSDMETDDWVWVHYPITSGFLDQWTPSQGRNHTPGGHKAYKLGQPGIGGYYASGVYAGLESPWLELSGDMVLEFSTWYNIESSNTAGEAYDGALVEITYDGVTYQQLVPAEGYTHQIISNPASPFAPNTPVFSGYSGGWLTYHADIPATAGNAKIRFTFGSDAASEEEGWYIDDVSLTPTTGIAPVEMTSLPKRFGIEDNYPNPFNPATTIRYVLTETGTVSLDIYDMSGRKIRTLVNGNEAAGEKEVRWNGITESGSHAASGIYLAVLRQGARQSVQKLILMK
ncbi:MAG: T9SS type A sorting domain-containing protein, partial [Calditrichia bacterium]